MDQKARPRKTLSKKAIRLYEKGNSLPLATKNPDFISLYDEIMYGEGNALDLDKFEDFFKSYYGYLYDWLKKKNNDADLPHSREQFIQAMFFRGLSHCLDRLEFLTSILGHYLSIEIQLFSQVHLREIAGIPRDLAEEEKPSFQDLLNTWNSLGTTRLKEMGLSQKGGSKSKHNFSLIRFWYVQTYEWVKQAKEIREKNLAADWKKKVTEVLQDCPEDLVERLGDLDPYQAQSHGIALEWAARRCGVPANTYSPRNLEKKLYGNRKRKDSKNTANTGTDIKKVMIYNSPLSTTIAETSSQFENSKKRKAK